MEKWVNHYEWLCFSAHLISLFHWTLFISAADATVAEITSTLSRNSLCNTRPDSQQARKNCLRISASFYFTKGRFNDGGKDRDTHKAFSQAQNTDMTSMTVSDTAAFTSLPRETKVPRDSQAAPFIASSRFLCTRSSARPSWSQHLVCHGRPRSNT